MTMKVAAVLVLAEFAPWTWQIQANVPDIVAAGTRTFAIAYFVVQTAIVAH